VTVPRVSTALHDGLMATSLLDQTRAQSNRYALWSGGGGVANVISVDMQTADIYQSAQFNRCTTGTSTATAPRLELLPLTVGMLVVNAQQPQQFFKDANQLKRERRDKALAVLQRWLAEPRSDDEANELKQLKQQLDKDRLSSRRLFPD
jgi:hypothetical protein